jgi:SAM-dependent methyltransferase
MKTESQKINWFSTLRRDIVRKVRQVGVLETLKHGVQKLIRKEVASADPFDAEYGTDTARIVSVGALDIPNEKLEHSNRYEAVVPEAFAGIMRDVPVAHEDYIFIDVGSGKGRALLLAARFPFRTIIGVEISASLTEIALSNIRIFKDGAQKCRDIRAVCTDGGGYEMPAEKTVLYLNNPFDDQVMRPFVSNVEKSLQQSPRKVFVVYQRPLHRFLWDQSKAFRLIKTTERYVIYESLAA